MQTNSTECLDHASLLNLMKVLHLTPDSHGRVTSTHTPTAQMHSLTSNMTDMVMGESTDATQEVFLTSMASHSLPLPSHPAQTLQNLQLQKQQLVRQQEQLEIQLKRMEIEENNLWDKSEQYQKQFAQYQQLLGHQQAQLELQLRQLALHHKYGTHCQKEILPGSCWM
eukprot:TRINITY_DN3627_c0_g1_i1.p1 TRINITY_DN3627_c0_g1~~TRINITY_DN3627_c0_g1_i1.p1  ORF type:complete len:168 (-),score=39.55 TRINITY_DN3627_c0_g1_i1:470-973(-)